MPSRTCVLPHTRTSHNYVFCLTGIPAAANAVPRGGEQLYLLFNKNKG